MSNRISFNDDETNNGIEGWYEELEYVRLVYVKATNSRYDWVRNFLMPRKHWFHQALWLAKYLIALPSRPTVIIGLSMGGAVALLTGTLYPYTIKVYTFGAPKPGHCDVSAFDVAQYRAKGDIVPYLPLLARRVSRCVVFGEWKPFWEAHASYSNIIRQIIKAEGG